MIYDQRKLLELHGFLERLAKALDLTESQYRDAVERYEKLGAFLNEEGSSLANFDPIISPQGSFALGTTIKPETDEEQYDVDLTCLLHLYKSQITQQNLKKMVGDRLKESPVYSRILGEEKRRCWPLEYAESTRFHMDVVPAIPDSETVIILRNSIVSPEIARTAICITDKETWDKDPNWPRNNPKGYIAWFKSRMQERLDAIQLRALSVEMRGKVEDIPEYKFKTPLQRAIQVLKRHRDRRFKGDPDLKPISIILTTLAAHAYNNEENIYETLINLLDRMPLFIKFENGKYRIENPVDPRENFADKWNENPLKAEAFYNWLKTAKADLKYLLSSNGWDDLTKRGGEIFGELAMRRVMNEYGDEMRGIRENASLRMEQSGLLGATGPAIVRPHQFSKTKTIVAPNPTRPVSELLDIQAQATALRMHLQGADVRLLHPFSFFYDENLPLETMSNLFRILSENRPLKPVSLVCDVNLQPTAMSRVYWVRIFYTPGLRPKVFVKYPRIKNVPGEILPHFNPDNTLCLYHSAKEWTPAMYLAETIVPWASEWLFHYEIWKGTGEWRGGGI